MIRNLKYMFTLFQKWYLFQRKKIPIQNLTRFEPFNNYKCIFVLSTGRCGTKLLTKILNFSSELWVDHKPSPELAFQSYRAYKYQYTLDQLKTDFSNSRLDMIKKCYKNSLIYCETNNRISLYARAISNIFPNAKFIHLVRHPGEFVRSGIRRGYYTRMNAEISGHLEPRENSSLIEKWSIMSQIEKIAWQWNTINCEIENFKKTIPPNKICTIQSQSMFINPEVTIQLFDFIGVANPFIGTRGRSCLKNILNHPINVQKIGSYPTYDNWSNKDKLTVKRMAPLAKNYGFTL
ncbi:MAG TPA: sulfotransferase [Candidatus Marinimicrobia bacterium]|nr:sulfotransferase [Candidatus Neomarinimicrobiota bacterium]